MSRLYITLVRKLTQDLNWWTGPKIDFGHSVQSEAIRFRLLMEHHPQTAPQRLALKVLIDQAWFLTTKRGRLCILTGQRRALYSEANTMNLNEYPNRVFGSFAGAV